MQTIDTGYKPQHGLGAWFAGENAANAEAFNQEELMKQFLANQRERQMQPLDVETKQLGLDPARYDAAYARAKMNSPDYIPANMAGQIGQMQTQEAAGATAKGLQPFKQKAEQAVLENQADAQGFQWTINDLNKKIAQGGDYDEQGNLVKATPNQMAFFQKKKDEITKQLAETPEYLQKDMLKDQQYASQLAIQEARNAAALAAAEQRHQDAKAKAENETQMLARLYRQAHDSSLTPEQRQVALATIQQYNVDKLSRNPAAYTSGLDVATMANADKPLPKTQTPLEKAQSSQQGGSTGQAVMVNNGDEWKALKPGTKFITPDGRTGTKQ